MQGADVEGDGRVPATLRTFDPVAFEAFIAKGVQRPAEREPALSLFSAGGIGDYGYRLAGFTFMAHAELDQDRLGLCHANHPRSAAVPGDLLQTWPDVVTAYKRVARGKQPALLSAMSPCQGMSTASAFHRVGKTDKPSTDPRNLLPFVIVDVAKALKPRVVVIENVPGILSTRVHHPNTGQVGTIAGLLADDLSDYAVYPATFQFADYGIPQRRRRTLLTFIRNEEVCVKKLDEAEKAPYPARTHDVLSRDGKLPWVTAAAFFGKRRYKPLNSKSAARARDHSDPLHFVPVYGKERYDLVRMIPPRSGKSAYQTDKCPHCDATGQPLDAVRCTGCQGVLHCKPITKGDDGKLRLIIGHNTSYKRMPMHLPASTVTTANGHLGSDTKIHPWQNRLLSPRETADLQTVPRTYNWAPRGQQPSLEVIRHVIGEAIPSWFTYLHGQALRSLLNGTLAVPYLLPRTETGVAVNSEDEFVAVQRVSRRRVAK